MEFNLKRTYVPIQEKLSSIEGILLSTLDGATGTYPVGSVEAFYVVEIAKLYTDIDLPKGEDGDSIDVVAAYDILAENEFDIWIASEDCAAKTDIARYIRILFEQIEKLEKYQTSAYGILDALNKDYGNLNYNVEELTKKLSEGDGVEFLKEIMKKETKLDN